MDATVGHLYQDVALPMPVLVLPYHRLGWLIMKAGGVPCALQPVCSVFCATCF